MSPREPPVFPSMIPAPHDIKFFVTADIADAYSVVDNSEYAGGVNPLGYKGHSFTPHGYGFHSSPGITITPSPYKPKRTHATYPAYDFGDDDEHVLSYASRYTISTYSPQIEQQEEESLTCTDLVGPKSPLIGPLTLQNVGISSWLSDTLYVLWRIVLMIVTLVACTCNVVQSYKYLAYAQGPALFFSVVTQCLLLHRAIWYQRKKYDLHTIHEDRLSLGFDGLMFQVSLHLCVTVWISFPSFALFFGIDSVPAGSGYIRSLSSYLLLAVTLLHVMDMFVTPIPFRITHVTPVTCYMLVLSGIASLVFGNRGVLIGALFVSGISTSLVGVLLHLMGRIIFVFLHAKYLEAMEDEVANKPNPNEGGP